MVDMVGGGTLLVAYIGGMDDLPEDVGHGDQGQTTSPMVTTTTARWLEHDRPIA
jgi:hypothetical protein